MLWFPTPGEEGSGRGGGRREDGLKRGPHLHSGALPPRDREGELVRGAGGFGQQVGVHGGLVLGLGRLKWSDSSQREADPSRPAPPPQPPQEHVGTLVKFQRWMKWRARSRAGRPWTATPTSRHGIRGVVSLSMKSGGPPGGSGARAGTPGAGRRTRGPEGELHYP